MPGTLSRRARHAVAGPALIGAGLVAPVAQATGGTYAATGSGFQLLVFALCVVVACVVLAAMLWSIVHHRKSRGHAAGSHAASMKAEILWTTVPILILVAMAVPAAAILWRSDAPEADEISVRVTGYQWKWEFDYLDQGVSYSSLRGPQGNEGESLLASVAGNPGAVPDVNQPLIVPAGARISVQLTSNDVNHGWWIPAFGRQQNAIPGHINEFSFRAREPGLYRGECTEFCGPPESCVPIAVQALPPEEFNAWLQGRAGSAASASPPEETTPEDLRLSALLVQGEVLHARVCAGCHQAGGQGLRAAGFPPLAGTQVSKDEHIRIALHGREGSAMAAFGDLLDDEELAAIVTYQRNAWGNDSGDVVRATEVAAAR